MMFERLLKINGACLRDTELNTPSPVAKLFCLARTAFELPRSKLRIGAHTCTNHTVPYGTVFWGGAFPGTSCLATISLSLWDKNRFRPQRLN